MEEEKEFDFEQYADDWNAANAAKIEAQMEDEYLRHLANQSPSY